MLRLRDYPIAKQLTWLNPLVTNRRTVAVVQRISGVRRYLLLQFLLRKKRSLGRLKPPDEFFRHQSDEPCYVEELPAIRSSTDYCPPGLSLGLPRDGWRQCPDKGVTAHGGPSGPLQFDRLGSHP
jgi:hypothetical protein